MIGKCKLILLIIMDLINIISSQTNEIRLIYETIGEMINDNEMDKAISKVYYMGVIGNANENVEIINNRLNQMDLDIIENDKLQSIKRLELSETIDNTIKENNKKNGLYKTELTKRLSKIKRETSEEYIGLTNGIGLLKVDVAKNNKNKELQLQVNNLTETLKTQAEEFALYKIEMEKVYISLRKEMRITRQMKIEKTKSLSIKQ